MFADGVEAAMRAQERFASDAEAAAFWAEGAPKVMVWDVELPGGDDQPQAARLYRGTVDGGHQPVLVYIHGGGWTGGSISANERACRMIAVHSGWAVFSLSYRFAPRHPWPAALSDCRAAYVWLMREGRGLGLDTGRIALGGASAGGNLALAMALSMAREPLAGLVLFYPVCGADFDTPSYRRFAQGFGLTRARMIELFAAYDPQGRRAHAPEIAPLCASLDQIRAAQVPPTAIVAAELDVLADDSRQMAERLGAAGVPVTLHVEPGVTHGFINRGRLIPAADACLSRSAAFLNSLDLP